MIQENVAAVKAQISSLPALKKPVQIVAASKYLDAPAMAQLWEAGISLVGENRVDALKAKQALLKHLPFEWHFIGTLQTRKVKSMINDIVCLHALDRLSLAAEIEKYRFGPLKCFVQVNISREPAKHGVAVEGLMDFLKALKDFSKIEVIGLMGMAEDTDDQQRIRECFSELASLCEKSRDIIPTCVELSMGMSGDYLLALEEGATFVRLGSVLFK